MPYLEEGNRFLRVEYGGGMATPSLLLLCLALAPSPQAVQTAHSASEVALLPSGRLDRAQALAETHLAARGLEGVPVLARDMGSSRTADRFLFERVVLGFPVHEEITKVVLFFRGDAVVEGGSTSAPGFLPVEILSAGNASSLAMTALSRPSTELSVASRRLVWAQGVLVHAVRVGIRSDGNWQEEVDGTIVSVSDLRRFGGAVDGTGQAFVPNPVQTSGNHGLKDQNDSANSVPSSEYFPVTLRDLDGTGYLTGPWCTTQPTRNRTKETSLIFNYLRDKDAFEEVVTYFSVDSFQRYLQAIGHPNANARPQPCDVNGTSSDNSWYDLGTGIITYGYGGVDDAEDADIILHEYGHALHDDVQGGIGNGQNSSMSEGYGDYLAATFYDSPQVGEWDAVSYTSGPWHFLRRTDLGLMYPNNLNGQVHHDGQIWAAMLWDLRMGCGRAIADNIMVEAMSLQSRNSGMVNAAGWLRTAEQNLYNGDWAPFVDWAIKKRGMDSVGSTEFWLSPSNSSPVAGTAIQINLNSPSDAGKAYHTLVSLKSGRKSLGAPYNVDIWVGLELLKYSNTAPGMIGTLDGSGQANFGGVIPPPFDVAVPIYFQAATLDAAVGLIRVSNPCAVRGVLY